MPSPAEMAAFGVTPELLDFVRSLTYSTFRDFPVDSLPPPVKVPPHPVNRIIWKCALLTAFGPEQLVAVTLA